MAVRSLLAPLRLLHVPVDEIGAELLPPPPNFLPSPKPPRSIWLPQVKQYLFQLRPIATVARPVCPPALHPWPCFEHHGIHSWDIRRFRKGNPSWVLRICVCTW